MQEITDIVDKLFSPDDYILDESGRGILGIRNIEESRKRNYITKLLLKLSDINKKIKNGDFNIGYRYTYEKIQNMKDDRQKIYNTLCKELNISVKEEENLQSIMTDDVREYFTRAINAGFMKEVDNGYRWKFGGRRGQARLGYFCFKVYDRPRPINQLERLFGVSKLSASITNAEFEPKRSDVKMWRKEIDDKIFF